MLKTCSRLKSIGDIYKKCIFAQPSTGIHLQFVLFDSVCGKPFCRKIADCTVQHKEVENIELLKGFSVSQIHLVTNFRQENFRHIFQFIDIDEPQNIEKIRRFMIDLQLKCNELSIVYPGKYFPISDVLSWKKVRISNETIYSMDQLLYFLQKKKEVRFNYKSKLDLRCRKKEANSSTWRSSLFASRILSKFPPSFHL